ncbi:hypothetical protein Lalb_Chr04g0258891 [Lupinus albus]|uniref:Uncharacterized protein n=1 Tax=Lupinus albus TaxID=3870 RepID=A0A6A4QN55_LUPAL|nr:hypothetical protein Lalb_Chr04g0258891 [Lupinus albus]
MRTKDGTDFGANVLLNLPHVLNMSVLTVERNPWKGSNQIGVQNRDSLPKSIMSPTKNTKVCDEIVKQCSES